MQPKFTPGPWTIKKDDDGGYAFVEIIGADKMQVAQLESAAGFDVETEADAHLISAAPEMREALAIFLDCFDRGLVTLPKTGLELARAALRKADGDE